MERAIKQRVMQSLDYMKMTIPSFARSINVPERTLFDQLKGNSKLALSTITSLVAINSNISLDWLILGIGYMQRAADASTNIHIDASGDHITGDGNATRGATINTGANAELEIENRFLKEQVEELKKDKQMLTNILSMFQHKK